MALYHISEVLSELYWQRAKENLANVELFGIQHVLDSGGLDEIGFLLDSQTMSAYEIRRAQHEFSLFTLRRN